jgi:beta-phosphoglucomutase
MPINRSSGRTQEAAKGGVIFDVDGVLIDSYHAHLASWQAMAAEQGWPLTATEFATTFGRTTREIIVERWSGEHELSEDDIAKLNQRKEALFREIVTADFPTMKGAVTLIRALHDAGFAMAAGSSGPTENVELALAHVDPDRLVQAAITGGDVTRGKPDPQVFQLAAAALGLSPRQCVVVEDAPAGITAAHAAGMPCVAIASTGRTKEELSAAEVVVDRLAEITPEVFAHLLDAGR